MLGASAEGAASEEKLLYSLLRDDLWSCGGCAAGIVCDRLSRRRLNVRLFVSGYVCVCVCGALRNLGVCFGLDKKKKNWLIMNSDSSKGVSVVRCVCMCVCERTTDCSWPLFLPSQEGIPDLLEPLQEQESNRSSLISLASVLLSSPPPPPSFHPSITLSSRHSIALWNAGPLGPRDRDVDQRSDYRQVSTVELYAQTVSNILEPQWEAL